MAGAAYHKHRRRQLSRGDSIKAAFFAASFFAFAVGCHGSVVAQDRPAVPAGLKVVGWGTGEAAHDGDTFFLEDPLDGARQVRLVGIEAVGTRRTGPAARDNHVLLAKSATDILDRLVRGRAVRLSTGGRARDRYGRHLAHVHLKDGRWLQAEMLRQGLARVNSFADNRALLRTMLEIEKKARDAGRGIWVLAYFRIRSPQELDRDMGSFQIVEGRVVDATRVRSRIYLNFGQDWRTDFTAQIEPQGVRAFARTRVNPLNYKGRTIRARGWVERYNGPMIRITHPEQIEIVK